MISEEYPTLNRDPLRDARYTEALELFRGMKDQGLDALEIGQIVNFLFLLSRRNIEAEASRRKPAEPHPPRQPLPEPAERDNIVLDACFAFSMFTSVDIQNRISSTRELRSRARDMTKLGLCHAVRTSPFVRLVGKRDGMLLYVLSPEGMTEALKRVSP